MNLSIDPGRVARDLPDLAPILDDPRLRPMGIVGGSSGLAVAALLQLHPFEPFWSAVVGGVLAFVGVPLLALGLAAPDPEDDNALFKLGVDLTPLQRRVVATGALLVVVSPILVAAVGPFVGFAEWLWIAAAAVALVGSVLILTGFVAWSSRTLADPRGTR